MKFFFRLRPICLRRSVYQTRSRKLFLANKEAARALVHNRVVHFLKYYGSKHDISVGKIAIRNQRSRWGSCSKKGNLNFNYKIALLPERLSEYIIVHELCHLGEFNHSRKFWNLVSKGIPDYLEIKNELKINGLKFH